MSSSDSLVDLALGSFAEDLAAPTPTPAGGSTAAAVGALGAALVSMAFRVAAGDGESGTPAYMAGRADELDDLREVLLEAVDRDAAAYRRWVKASKQARADDEQAAQAALEVFEVPLEIAEHAIAALRLLHVGAAEVPAPLASDLEVARHTLEAAARGGLATATANLEVLDQDDARAADLRATLESLTAEVARLVAAGAEGRS